MRICIINSPYYEHISAMLLDGAKAVLAQYDDIEYDVYNVPGALEIPAFLSMVLSSNKNYDGFIALGCVIRGETTHYDYVAADSAKSLLKLSIQYKVPVTNGILTVENEAQAISRADKNQKDKGGFAAKACVEMVKLKNTLNGR